MVTRRLRPNALENKGVASNIVITGQKIPIRVQRPTLNITREAGTKLNFQEEEGGTHRLIVESHARESNEPIQEQERAQELRKWLRESPEKRFSSEEYWSLFNDFEKHQCREYWEHRIPEKERIESELYWRTVPWNEKFNDERYAAFEARRAKNQRGEIKDRVVVEKAIALLNKEKELVGKLNTSWGQRKRNAGIGNKLFWRPFGLLLDIAALPFFVGSKLLSWSARPISWINDKLLGTVSYSDKGTGAKRTKLPAGTTKKAFFPSLFAERGQLAKIRSQLKTISPAVKASALEIMREEAAAAKKKAA